MTKFRKQLISAGMVLSYLFGRWSDWFGNSGFWFFNRMLYKGGPGAVLFDVDEEEADGFLVYRTQDEYRQLRLETVYFRLSNRWPVRNGRIPGPAVLMDINSQALEIGFNVVRAQWNPHTHKARKVPLVPVASLPQDGSIERDNARRKRVQDALARWFPTGDNHREERLRNAAESILKQV